MDQHKYDLLKKFHESGWSDEEIELALEKMKCPTLGGVNVNVNLSGNPERNGDYKNLKTWMEKRYQANLTELLQSRNLTQIENYLIRKKLPPVGKCSFITLAGLIGEARNGRF